MTRQEKVQFLLNHPDLLLLKKPFTRGGAYFAPTDNNDGDETNINVPRRAVLPNIKKVIVTQDRFALELDPKSHEVIFDDNLPSICVKLKNGSYGVIKHKRHGLPFQMRIREKQTLSLCGNPIKFTLRNDKPSQTDSANFATFKEYWVDRNQDGMITKAVYTQLGYGDAGLLYYYNDKGEIKSRLISYEDGYVIISHNDDNGERVMECVYYKSQDGIEYIDCYDDKYRYRFTSENEWSIKDIQEHGFDEIPLATKRGEVAWNNVQDLIDAFEILFNIYLVIEKRHGWGVLYIRGKIKETVKKIAGSIILNDTSVDGNGSAEFKQPPTPEGVNELLETIKDLIQIGSSCTFILPKDIKSSGDISGLAITLTQELDMEGATNKVIEWQNFVDKCKRLFKEGLAKELVNKGEVSNAVTAFKKLRIGSTLQVWRPFSKAEYNQMLATLKNAGGISKQTLVEKNTESLPDESQRIAQEENEARALQQQQIANQQQLDTNKTVEQNAE